MKINTPILHEGMAVVELNGKWGVIDAKGKVIAEPQYDFPEDTFISFNEGLAAVYANGKWGYISNKGKMVGKWL